MKPIKIVFEDNTKIISEEDKFKFNMELLYKIGEYNLAALDCSNMSDEEIDRIIEEFNNIPEVYPIRTEGLKNERTGSSTIRKCKFIGQILEFTDTKVKVGRLSPPDRFVTPEECKDYGVDTVYPDDVIHVIISRHQLDNWLCLPQTIGNITFYSKKELVEWIENQQALNEECNKEDMESIYRFLEERDGVPVVNPTF